MRTKNKAKQIWLIKNNWKHRHSYGGQLRQSRQGRGHRPLSTRTPLHLVFKIDRQKLKGRSLRQAYIFALVTRVIHHYAHRFLIKVEQVSIQHDHIHLLVRTTNRSFYQYFFRVVAGQIAQQLGKKGYLASAVTGTPKAGSLWKYRPFTRVVIGQRALKVVRDYIQLNELEVIGKIRYLKQRLKGMTAADWAILYS